MIFEFKMHFKALSIGLSPDVVNGYHTTTHSFKFTDMALNNGVISIFDEMFSNLTLPTTI
jgi:hypothetical protein